MKIYFLFFLCVLCIACSENEEATLFQLRSDTAIQFHNILEYTEEYNPYTYRNFYNGGGVALGDINNDGLVDIYFTGNLVSNKMFLNKGNWVFEDITEISGLGCHDVWSAGATFVDINADGLLDLYVCKAGKPGGPNRQNELFINQGNLQFEEKANEYGLDIEGLSIQAAFLDYDKDGDLDCYLLNNSIKAVGGFDLQKDKRLKPSADGNKFLVNENGKYIDKSLEAGIYTSEIGFGLGVTISDFNLDTWPDLYLSNDFFEKDYLYINNQDGTFREASDDYFSSLPLGAMGADAADIDNDLNADLMVTEMLPSTLERKKTKAVYESWKKFNQAQTNGYHRQYPRNTLQRNLGNQKFVEIGRKAQVEATDWSWSSLIQDFDNDGLKDIFVSNGIYKDLLDRDYLNFIGNDAWIRSNVLNKKSGVSSMIDSMPSQAVSNVAFKNQGDFNFENITQSWGLDQLSFSNGCAYGDLDNDGDLDLVVNNVNMPSFIYENQTYGDQHNYVKLRLKGKGNNTKAIGAKTIVYACDHTYMVEQFPSRGFQSSIANELFIGLGACAQIDSLVVIWPNGDMTKHLEIPINQVSEISHLTNVPAKTKTTMASEFDGFVEFGSLDYQHEYVVFNQFNRERLLYKMNAVTSPILAVSDINGDHYQDVFIGGAKHQSSALFLADESEFVDVDSIFINRKRSEVVHAQFFDSDGDGDLDLIIGNGGTAYSAGAPELFDELYLNDGQGNLTPTTSFLNPTTPINNGAIAIADYNNDGLPDILLGDRGAHLPYGTQGSAYLYQNKGDNQYDLVQMEAFKHLGMITDAGWIDINQDGQQDLIIIGEWMNIKLFIQDQGDFIDQTIDYGLDQTKGLWNKLLIEDVNGDGLKDLFLGNIGENTALRPNHLMYIDDFDGNGSVEQILCQRINGKDYPVLEMDELLSQLPHLKKQFVRYKDYAQKSMTDIFNKKQLQNAQILELDDLKSTLFIQSNHSFESVNLPDEIQYSSIHAILAHDFNRDGIMDLIVGGNDDLVKPQYGAEDASSGWLLTGVTNATNQVSYPKAQSIGIHGRIRDFKPLNNDQLLVAIQGEKIKMYNFDQLKN